MAEGAQSVSGCNTTLALVIGFYIPSVLMHWVPRLTGTATQVLSFGLRFGTAYILITTVCGWQSRSSARRVRSRTKENRGKLRQIVGMTDTRNRYCANLCRMIRKLKQTPGIYLVGFMGSGKASTHRTPAGEAYWMAFRRSGS